MYVKKTQRTYDHFGARGTTARYYWRDKTMGDDTFNGNSKALLVAPVIIATLALLSFM